MAKEKKDNRMDKLVSLSKRRGFIFQSSEIYGGLESTYDYGPLGVEMKNNIKRHWWKTMVQLRDDIVGIDAAILMHPKVWEASGHVAEFTDPLVECQRCGHRFREDELETPGICPDCGGPLSPPRKFNLMFKTHMGPVEDEASVVYLRPETAQGIYVNFLNVLQTSRQKIPFGIAQVGKAFRNEITTKAFIFRTREFEQMEMQYFVKPETADEWFEFWKEERLRWYLDLGVRAERLRYHEHAPEERAHYAKAAFDIEYDFPFGWKELEGVHNRSDFDLRQHQEYSGKDMSYFDDATRERYIPWIIETSAGADRTFLMLLADAYDEEEVQGEVRTVLRLSPKIAPIKAGVFPLVKRDGMPEIAHRIADSLKPHFMVFYDEGGAIGRRYRRQDEAGTPFGITVDSQTLEDGTVTVRERDSMRQERVAMDRVVEVLRDRVEGC